MVKFLTPYQIPPLSSESKKHSNDAVTPQFHAFTSAIEFIEGIYLELYKSCSVE